MKNIFLLLLILSLPSVVLAYETTDDVMQRKSAVRNIPLDTSPAALESRQTHGAQQTAAAGQRGADRALSTQIRQNLMTDQQIAANLDKIRISSVNGRVTLRGSVDSEELRKNIEAQVQTIAGVNSVDNKLRVVQD